MPKQARAVTNSLLATCYSVPAIKIIFGLIEYKRKKKKQEKKMYLSIVCSIGKLKKYIREKIKKVEN